MIFNCIPPVSSGSGGLTIETGNYTETQTPSSLNYSRTNPPSLTFQGKPKLIYIWLYSQGEAGVKELGGSVYGDTNNAQTLCLIPEQGWGWWQSRNNNANYFRRLTVEVFTDGNTVSYYPFESFTRTDSSLYKVLMRGTNDEASPLTYYWVAFTERE